VSNVVVDVVVVVVTGTVVVDVVVVVVTNPSNVSGHGVPAEVQPSGSSMHTNGYPAGPVSDVHSLVPLGHTVNEVPGGPVGPCAPVLPGITAVQSAKAWSTPAIPAAGIFSTVTAYEAVFAVAPTVPADAVSAVRLYAMFVGIVAGRPIGK
jgi:hypothetical protein